MRGAFEGFPLHTACRIPAHAGDGPANTTTPTAHESGARVDYLGCSVDWLRQARNSEPKNGTMIGA